MIRFLTKTMKGKTSKFVNFFRQRCQTYDDFFVWVGRGRTFLPPGVVDFWKQSNICFTATKVRSSGGNVCFLFSISFSILKSNQIKLIIRARMNVFIIRFRGFPYYQKEGYFGKIIYALLCHLFKNHIFKRCNKLEDLRTSFFLCKATIKDKHFH